MVISNIGTIVASFTPSASEASKTTAGSQVRLISVANTLSRLATGPLADFTSPIPVRHPSGELHFHPKRSVTRIVFVFATSVFLLCAFAWMAIGIVSVEGVWFLSVLTGAAYGMIWQATSCFVYMGPLSDMIIFTGLWYLLSWRAYGAPRTLPGTLGQYVIRLSLVHPFSACCMLSCPTEHETLQLATPYVEV